MDLHRIGRRFQEFGHPCIRDRVVQGALKLILEAIFEADFCPNSYGFRPTCPGALLLDVRHRPFYKVLPPEAIGMGRLLMHETGRDNKPERGDKSR